MSYLTYLFPLAALIFVIYIAYSWLPVFADKPVLDGAPPDEKKPFSFRAGHGKILRIDVIAMALITAVYGIIAFAGLGDTVAPQSFCEFADRGRYVLVELPEETDISIRCYTGLHTGEYRIEMSNDGLEFWDVATLEQKSSQVFKWLTVEFDEGASTSARFIRITASKRLALGELAIYDSNGSLIPADELGFDAGAATLFDEQGIIPDRASYMNSSYFDEIYHARTAYEHLTDVNPYEITHPPLGKIIISIGIMLFGMTPFGWRFSGTLFGVLMLPILYLLIKRMFASTKIAACGTIIFAFDFMHFTQTRIATIDTYAVFFILLMYLFMWRYVSGGSLWDLALSGLFFGMGAASKWTCIYAGGGLAVIWLIHWITRRREEMFWGKFLSNCALCLVLFVAVPCGIYYLSYFPYGVAKGLSGDLDMLFSKDYANIVWSNQVYMWEYHSDLVATHPYSSRWYQWIADARPILYYRDIFEDGTKSAFGAFMNPVFCWSGFFAMIGCGILAVKDRDGKAVFIVLGYLAQLLPWVLVSRLTFAYHYFTTEVFLLLALCYMFKRMKQLALPRWKNRMYALTGVCTGLFVAFYPVLSGLRVPTWYTSYFLRWFPSWPF